MMIVAVILMLSNCGLLYGETGLYTDTGLSFNEIGTLHVSGQRLVINAHFSIKEYFEEISSIHALLTQITKSNHLSDLQTLDKLPSNAPNNSIRTARTL